MSSVWSYLTGSSAASSSSSLIPSAASTPPRPVLSNADAINPQTNPLNPKGLKPCCACPETKTARDDCFLLHGSNMDEGSDSATHCGEIVQRHLECMRGLGFNV